MTTTVVNVHPNGVREVLDADRYQKLRPAAVIATCNACGRSWDDTHTTGYTPAPSARCPFEYEHPEPVVPYQTGHQVFWMRDDFAEPKPITIVGDDDSGIVYFVEGHHTVFSTARGNVVVTP